MTKMSSSSSSIIPHISNWIDGAHRSSITVATPSLSSNPQDHITVINPATEQPLATIDATSPEEIRQIIARSLANFNSKGITTTTTTTTTSSSWSTADASTRFQVLTKAALLLRERIPEFVKLETQQTGRPIREMATQLSRVPEWLEYFAGLARTYEGAVTPFKGPVVNTLVRKPLGVVAQITPWNHPLLIATKKIGAALAAGNVVVVKPSELAPLSVLRLGRLFQEAGLPDGTLQIVCGYGSVTGKAICEDPRLAKIDITGGLGTYRAVAPVAALNMVPVMAELGGKAPVCIFPSMDVEQAVKAALFASFIASGQTCVTGSRLLVHADIYDAFVARLVERTKGLRVGDPMDSRTQIGAVISRASVDRCIDFVSRATGSTSTQPLASSISAAAAAVAEAEAEASIPKDQIKIPGSEEATVTLLCGGQPTTVNNKGFFFQPTLIATPPTSHLSLNEVFGPVIAVTKCPTESSIIDCANSTSFALGASIWTNDFAQAHRVADQIDAGIVWINGHHLNDPSSSWGGWKESGIGGRENGREAYEGYTKVKSTVINYGVGVGWFDEDVGEGGVRYG